MNSYGSGSNHDEIDEVQVRSLLDQLIADSRLYRSGAQFKALLHFVVRLRDFAPFNAMLLQIQKPGLSYAASAGDWKYRFGRRPSPGARPLLILWPFGPVALVYDVLDTEGSPLPKDAFTFRAEGTLDARSWDKIRDAVAAGGLEILETDTGDFEAGQIIRYGPVEEGKGPYRIELNRNHPPQVRFATMAHELAHLFLGHLGKDEERKIESRIRPHVVREVEAETAAYLVCHRRGLLPNSDRYLSGFIKDSVDDRLDVYAVMRAAGRIESLIGTPARSRFPGPRDRVVSVSP